MDLKILVVEDESGLATIKDRLGKEGASVRVAKNGTAGLELATRGTFRFDPAGHHAA